MIDVRANCRNVLERIQAAAAKSRRDPNSIRLIAVTKTVSPDRIREAIACGIHDVGENKLQEGLSKREALSDLPIRWHFIGHLQTNKAKKVVENFDCVQSVDRLDLAEKLDQHASAPLPILVEVNLGGEDSKSGVAVADLPGLIESLKALHKLQVQGLMTIPPYRDNPEDSRALFAQLRGLAERFALPELSMGMSHDFEIAIEEGATMVRVGTSLFGARQ